MKIDEAVRARIIELCEARQITINKMANMGGVNQSTLNNVVGKRRSSITVATLQKLCDGQDISIIDFFNSPLFHEIEQELK